MAGTQVEPKVKKERKPQTSDKSWYIVDAKNKVLGRIATRIAIILMGKHKPTWQPYLDDGDYVIVINASKIGVSGRKEEQKTYYRYSGYPGGLKTEILGKLRKRKPEDIIYHAVAGMLPKNRLGAAMIKKLYIYPSEKHPHEAQKPQELEV
ncbi:MAG: 50S ribosomal protein L13 [Candidatus Woykebacteria bacterium RBG_16_43_9]|uniref:Large ribosomal subunit protein uL13 n=1 Tax=Candidatus Woykebacteria bacterium RBG_16_43_9 TaxID=1802596 RepID=A0A1G1WGC6_9BACT|nr:MAG: 50S ribosomal protein L13 [Candidatus Woykebacteria bacterium RBG_16_43_9]